MTRFACLLLLGTLVLGGCKLPRLPNMNDVKEVLPVVSAGASLKEALAAASPLATTWSPGAELVEAKGLSVDYGGRSGGLKQGVWLFAFRGTGKAMGFEVRVEDGKQTTREVVLADASAPALPGGLEGLLDSPDVLSKSGLSGRAFTLSLRSDPAGTRFNVVAEGTTDFVVLDAKSGEKLPAT